MKTIRLSADRRPRRKIVSRQRRPLGRDNPWQGGRYGRVQPQGFVDYVAQIRQLPEVLVGEVLRQGLQLGHEFLLDLGMAAYRPGEIGQGDGGGIAAGDDVSYSAVADLGVTQALLAGVVETRKQRLGIVWLDLEQLLVTFN